jgi:hypothetical protein
VARGAPGQDVGGGHDGEAVHDEAAREFRRYHRDRGRLGVQGLAPRRELGGLPAEPLLDELAKVVAVACVAGRDDDART